MISKNRFNCIIQIILPMMLAFLIMPLPSCSKLTWTLGGNKEIEEERMTKVANGKDFSSSISEGDLKGNSELPDNEGLVDREAADAAKASSSLIGSDLKKESGIEDVHFDFDKYTIKDEYMEILKRDAEWLSSNPIIKVVIEGQADERGTTEYNLVLGERRAQSVKKHLIVLGIEPLRINTISYGEEKPVCTEHSEECWWKNRRAHFAVRK